MDGVGSRPYTNEYVVGQRHEDSTDKFRFGIKRLFDMSCGAVMRRIQQVESKADYLLLDEIHCRSDPTVVAGNL